MQSSDDVAVLHILSFSVVVRHIAVLWWHMPPEHAIFVVSVSVFDDAGFSSAGTTSVVVSDIVMQHTMAAPSSLLQVQCGMQTAASRCNITDVRVTNSTVEAAVVAELKSVFMDVIEWTYISNVSVLDSHCDASVFVASNVIL